MQQHVDHRNQYLRRGEVEIDLVLTEGGPQMSHAAIMKCERREKGKARGRVTADKSVSGSTE